MPGIILGPRPAGTSSPTGVQPTTIGNAEATENGTVPVKPLKLPGQPESPSCSSTSVAQDSALSTAQSATTQVQANKQAADRSGPSQPSQGIALGPQTVGAVPTVETELKTPTHVEITVSDGGNDAPAPKKDLESPPKSNRGGIANGITFFLLVVGLVLQVILEEDAKKYNYVLAVGVFGFAGGITNWLAVKMLFDKIPGLYGSGVIPNQYKNIRKTVKREIMFTFFDEDYLKGYLRQRAPELLKKLNLSERLMNVIDSPDFDSKLAAKLEEISATPQGMLLSMVKPFMGGSLTGLVPMVKPPLRAIASEIANELTTIQEEEDGEAVVELIPVDVVRSEIDALMTERLETLTPEVVKKLLEDVIREHLGWLVVWGNIFGSMIGVIALGVTGEV